MDKFDECVQLSLQNTNTAHKKIESTIKNGTELIQTEITDQNYIIKDITNETIRIIDKKSERRKQDGNQIHREVQKRR